MGSSKAASTPPIAEKTAHILSKLADLSVKNYYNPYREFIWPESIPEDCYWMSPAMMSVAGTPQADSLSQEQMFRLSKWEGVHFCSLNVHGIRDLLLVVLQSIHRQGFEIASPYFHHFVGEENEHMWFFAEFSLRYGGKIYLSKTLRFNAFEEPEIQTFLAFAKILIFEEIGDFYNRNMKEDEQLPPIFQQINRLHHEDESRHITMGRQLIQMLFQELTTKYSAEKLREVGGYLKRYMISSVQAFYNPEVYADAGISDPYAFRKELLKQEARLAFHRLVLKRTLTFFTTNGILEQGGLPENV